MNIDDEIGRLRAEKSAEQDMEVLKRQQAQEAWRSVRNAFESFRAALQRHNVPSVQVVRISHTYAPGRKGVFRWIPEQHHYTAAATDMQGWLFRGILVLTDGRLMNDPRSRNSFNYNSHWGIGSIASIDPRDPESPSEGTRSAYQANVLAAGQALRSAGRGPTVSASHLYIPSDRVPEEISAVAPRTVSRHWRDDALEFSFANNALMLHDDGHLTLREDRYDGPFIPLERYFAEYIESEQNRRRMYD